MPCGLEKVLLLNRVVFVDAFMNNKFSKEGIEDGIGSKYTFNLLIDACSMRILIRWNL